MPDRVAVVILAVADLARARGFYEATFGWSRTADVAVYVELGPPGGGSRVGLYQREGYGKNIGRLPAGIPAGEVGAAEVYLHVDDPAATLARALAAGARLLSPLAPRGWGDEAAYVADLDGHVLALARPRV